MKNNQADAGITALSKASAAQIRALRPLTAALLLGALPRDERLAGLRHSLTARMRAQVSPKWIADGDAATVFAVLAALANQRPSALNGSDCALAIRRLVASESAVGGPYAFDGSVTPGTNALVACLLQKITKIPPNLQAYLNGVAAQGQPDPVLSPAVLNFLLQRLGHKVSLASFGAPRANGLWPAKQLIKNEPASELVVTALAIATQNTARQQAQQQLHDTVIQKTEALFARQAPAVSATANQLIGVLARADTSHEIALTPYLFAQSLARPTALSTNQLHDLCAANVCGWLAYMVYDDILDGESPPTHLPLANIASRLSMELFNSIDKTRRRGSGSLAAPTLPPKLAATRLFTVMDQANAWETAKARLTVQNGALTIGTLPHYSSRMQLARRSIGHALGPLIVAAHANALASQLRMLHTAICHFLIARQLADDLLDWRQDIAAGHATFAVTAILRDLKQKPGTYPLEGLLPRMQAMFAERTCQRIGRHMIGHVGKAQQIFASSGILTPQNHLSALLENLMAAGQNALSSHERQQSFLTAYTQADLLVPLSHL